ncbi:hypothetical protein ACM43_01355 [Bradyrhizobium sp. CCBAU 45321]|nr:hypothetical protein [Bradyrhizobium sp. CCBAU 45321]
MSILWKTSIFHRREYQSSFSIASLLDCTGRYVRSFHSIFFLFFARSSFISVDHCQSQSWIPRLLAYGWQNTDFTIPDFTNSLVWIALAILDFDPVEAFDHDLVHYRCNGMIAIACQAIDTGPYQKCVPTSWAAQNNS